MEDCNINVLALCACHISNEHSKFRFQRLLKSVLTQDFLGFKFIVSCSSEDNYKNSLIDIIEENNEHSNLLQLEYSDEKLTQFQHYKRLNGIIQDSSNIENTWIIFSDADDLWDPKRISFYLERIENIQSGICVILPHWFAKCPSHMIRSVEDEFYVIQCYNEICSNYDTKECPLELVVAATDRSGNRAADGGMAFEYFQCCVRYKVFENFFELCTEEHLASSWCDLAFTSYLDKVWGKNVFLDIESWQGKNNDQTYLYLKVGEGSTMYGFVGLQGERTVEKVTERRRLVYFPEEPPSVSNIEILNNVEQCIIM